MENSDRDSDRHWPDGFGGCGCEEFTYILAPTSRALYSASIYDVNGTVKGSKILIGESADNARFEVASAVTLDFEKVRYLS